MNKISGNDPSSSVPGDYWKPFYDEKRKRWLCGSPRHNCKCGFKFKGVCDKTVTHCPDCGKDRRCMISSAGVNELGERRPCKRFHNGNAKLGILNQNYKHGQRSRHPHLPGPIAERFNAVLSDPELLSLHNEVSLQVTRMWMLAERLHSGESGSLWSDLLLYWNAFESATQKAADARIAIEEGDESAQSKLSQANSDSRSALSAIGKTITKGVKDEAAWKELITASKDVVDTKSKATKVMTEQQQMLSVPTVMVLFGRLVDAVRSNVDQDVAKQILSRMDPVLLEPLGVFEKEGMRLMDGTVES